MKKLILASAAIAAATVFAGSAFAIPGARPATIRASGDAVKVSCGCYRPNYRYYGSCCGYYSLYTYTTPCGCYSGCGGHGWRLGGGFIGGIFGW